MGAVEPIVAGTKHDIVGEVTVEPFPPARPHPRLHSRFNEECVLDWTIFSAR